LDQHGGKAPVNPPFAPLFSKVDFPKVEWSKMWVYGGFAPVWSKMGVYGGFAPV